MIVNNGENAVITGPILWNGIAEPNQNDDGSISHNLRIAIVENSVENQEIEQLATAALVASPFKGVLPVNGNWPTNALDLSKFGDSAPMLAGHLGIAASTRNGIPPVYDANGNLLNAMQYNQMLYCGAIVELLIHFYDYDNKKKGIAAGLDGIRILDATTPKLDVGGGMSANQVASVFGAPAGTPPAQTQAAVVQQPPAQHTAANGATITPPPTVQPNTAFVENAGVVTPPPTVQPQAAAHVMTVAAQGMTYEAAIGAGWTDESLIANGMMQA